MRSAIIIVLAALATPGRAPAQQVVDRKLAADIDTFVQKVMALGVSVGLSVAVVNGTEPVLVKGYGYADLEKKRPVTAKTGFYIASTTKSFTSLMIAMMAERGLLKLDVPINAYLPDLKLKAPLSADSITLRMLLSHTHGISGDGPVVWRTAFNGAPSDPELVRLMQYHAASPSGHNYKYTNVGYNLAGLVVGRVAQKSWKQVLDAEVLGPLKLRHTTAVLSRYDSVNLAMPYSAEARGFSRLHYAKNDASMHAAGGLVSTGNDLARWLEVQMNDGKIDGKQVFPAKVIAETHRKQTDVAEAGEFKRTGYALGWTIADFQGQKVIMHTGGFSAFSSIVVFDPQTKMGVAVMANEAKLGSGAGHFVAQYALDRAAQTPGYEAKYADLLARLPEMLAKRRAAIEQDRARRAARPQTLPYPIAALTGTYFNDLGGTMTVTENNGRLWLQSGNLKSIAEVFDAATSKLRVELEPGSGEVVSFEVADDKAKSLEFQRMKFIKR